MTPCPRCRAPLCEPVRRRHRELTRCHGCGFERWRVVAQRADAGGRAGVEARARANARQAHVPHRRSGLSKLASEGLEGG